MLSAIYNVTYRALQNDGEVCEEIAEVSAYSEIQAIFLAPCAPEDVLYVECAVVKKHATL